MAVDLQLSFTALQRFGLGARPGDLSKIAADPRGALLAEIAPKVPEITGGKLLDTADALAAVATIRMDRKASRQANASTSASDAPDAPAADAAMTSMSDTPATDPADMPKAKRRKTQAGTTPAPEMDDLAGNPLLTELAARVRQASNASVGFAERWAMFWSNHFAIQASSNQQVRWMAGPYDREAIRPNVFGRFEDLLLAATRHPAMLRYLNNATSIGPDSRAGKKRDKGLNENHARELMELHTLGVDGGYTQADVTSFAKVLTGWTYGQNADNPQTFGRFQFMPNTHEPGSQTVLGHVFDERGVKQGEDVLHLLATHPATATHLATQLVRHFVADDPPPELVTSLATNFQQTGGDLAALARTLVSADAAWEAPATKLRSPQEYLLAATRALSITPPPNLIRRALDTLGQPLFDPPAPQGYKDDVATWLAPDAMLNRLDIAELLGGEADSSADVREVADTLLGPAQSAATREAIARAEGPVQGFAILLMSPEFQRR